MSEWNVVMDQVNKLNRLKRRIMILLDLICQDLR